MICHVAIVPHRGVSLVVESTASTMHYTLKDHQGSLTATVCGNAVERLSYDAWGRRRNPNGFGYSNVSHTFDRGFTLHEHYDDFGLINMNGRLYDPVIGRSGQVLTLPFYMAFLLTEY